MKYKNMLSCIKNIGEKYELNLPLIKRKFDSIFLSYKKLNSSFGYFFDDLFLENIIIGISKFNNKFLFYKLDLDNLIEEEFILDKIKIINKKILNKNYSFLILKSENKNIKILTNLKNIDFNFYVEKDIFYIKNKILNSIILKEKINFFDKIFLEKADFSNLNIENSNQSIEKTKNLNINNKNLNKNILENNQNNFKYNQDNFKNNYTSILDIYFLDNFFIKTQNSISFEQKIEKFIFENNILDKEFLPKNILKIYEKGKLKNKKSFLEKIFFWKQEKNFYEKLELLKIFLEFKNFYNQRFDLINYEDLKKYFIDFEDSFTLKNFNQNINNFKINFSKIDLEEIDINLISINKQIGDFILNFNSLEKNYNKIKDIENNLEISKILEQKNRLEITRKNIEKVKKTYIEYFKKFLEKIK